MHLIWQRQQCLREELNRAYMDRKLAGFGYEEIAFHSDEVTVIQQSE